MILYSSNCRVDIRIAPEVLQSGSPLFFGATATDHGVATKKSDLDRQSHEHRWPGFTTNLEDFYGWAIHSSVLMTSPTKPCFKSSQGFWKRPKGSLLGAKGTLATQPFFLAFQVPQLTLVMTIQAGPPWFRIKLRSPEPVRLPWGCGKTGRQMWHLRWLLTNAAAI